MGWSATAVACDEYDRWSKACVAQTGSQNVYRHKGVEYFFETGREQADGAIVGSVFWMVKNDADPGSDGVWVARAGSFRIDPDGNVVRWPTGLRKVVERGAS